MRFLFFVGLCACGARTELAGTTTSDAGTQSACQDEIVAQDPQGATALAVDGDDVFWGTTDGMVRARHAGVVTTLATASASIDSITFDSQYVYFTSIGAVARVPRAGGASSTVLANAGVPFALATSGADLFWVNYGAGIAAGSIVRNGAPILDMLDTPGGLAVTDSNVFTTCALALVNQQGVTAPLLRVSHDGTNVVTLLEGLHQPGGVAAFGGRVYYIEQSDAQSTLHGGVRSIDENGGTPKLEIATNGYLPIDLAVDASGVWATAFSQGESILLHGSMTVDSTQAPNVGYEAVRTSATAVYWVISYLGPKPLDGATVRKKCK